MAFDLYTKALNGMTGGGQATNVSKGFFWTFIVLCVGVLTGIFSLIFSTFQKTSTSSEDEGSTQAVSTTLSTETITSLVFVGIGILSLTAGLIGGFTSNSGSGTFSKMAIGFGSLFQLIGLMIARKSNDLSDVDQTGYNITICLILAQAIFGISGVPTIDTVFGSINSALSTHATNAATGLTNIANTLKATPNVVAPAPAPVAASPPVSTTTIPSGVSGLENLAGVKLPGGGRYSRKF